MTFFYKTYCSLFVIQIMQNHSCFNIHEDLMLLICALVFQENLLNPPLSIPKISLGNVIEFFKCEIGLNSFNNLNRLLLSLFKKCFRCCLNLFNETIQYCYLTNQSVPRENISNFPIQVKYDIF